MWRSTMPQSSLGAGWFKFVWLLLCLTAWLGRAKTNASPALCSIHSLASVLRSLCKIMCISCGRKDNCFSRYDSEPLYWAFPLSLSVYKINLYPSFFFFCGGLPMTVARKKLCVRTWRVARWRSKRQTNVTCEWFGCLSPCCEIMKRERERERERERKRERKRENKTYLVETGIHSGRGHNHR